MEGGWPTRERSTGQVPLSGHAASLSADFPQFLQSWSAGPSLPLPPPQSKPGRQVEMGLPILQPGKLRLAEGRASHSHVVSKEIQLPVGCCHSQPCPGHFPSLSTEAEELSCGVG